MTTILMAMVLTDPDTVRKNYGDKWNELLQNKLLTSQNL